MSVAEKLSQYLAKAGVRYDTVTHPKTVSSSRTAQAAHVPGARVAKGVVLHDEQGYVLAVVPTTHRVELDTLQDLLGRRLNLATEGEIASLFPDCELGAVPAPGAAYGIETVVDEALLGEPEVFFEAGDHQTLVRVAANDFQALMADAKRGRFSHHV